MSGLDPTMLRLSRALLARTGGWTQRAMARNAKSEAISHLSRDAVCFCPAGAIARACRTERLGEDYRAAFNEAVGQHPRSPLAFWNDVKRRTAAEVLAVFDRLIIAALAAAGAAQTGEAS